MSLFVPTQNGVNVPGGNVRTACSEFKNLGQCVAAMHDAKNLSLNFSDLQSKITGANSVSLGKVIQQLGGSDVNAKSETKKANKLASQDLSFVESDRPLLTVLYESSTTRSAHDSHTTNPCSASAKTMR